MRQTVHQLRRRKDLSEISSFRYAGFLCISVALTACFGPPKSATSEAEIAAMENHTALLPNHPANHINYIKAGDPNGQPVILVHGTPGSTTVWADMISDVQPGYEYIAIDRPGFGQSGPKESLTDISLHASALMPLSDHSSGKKPILVGHSYGGPVVVQAALDYPDAFAGIIVAAGALDPALEETHFMQYVGDTWPISALLPRAIKNANEELFSLKADLEVLAPRLKELKIPTIIVHGTKDDLVPVANVDYMEKMFPQNSLIHVTLIQDQNHFLPWNSLEELHEAIAMMKSHTEAGQ
ncbi:alpha/beta fold hydrolase [Curvivirga aplysinae]|uniref:alpha/beta fold hydrolase n=1 Tax=Curvivirga aplysinae TaxID=2529852 RepID=UPI0012BD1792|nr:alpha/beta hydrolase [Curvivirga aplysinae]MTI09412.1 alpha/beta hydrolase [Curvivirga aplysinae]